MNHYHVPQPTYNQTENKATQTVILSKACMHTYSLCVSVSPPPPPPTHKHTHTYTHMHKIITLLNITFVQKLQLVQSEKKMKSTAHHYTDCTIRHKIDRKIWSKIDSNSTAQVITQVMKPTMIMLLLIYTTIHRCPLRLLTSQALKTALLVFFQQYVVCCQHFCRLLSTLQLHLCVATDLSSHIKLR